MSEREAFEHIRQIAWSAVGTDIERADKALVKIHEYAKEQAARATDAEDCWLIQLRGEYRMTRGNWERPEHRGYTNDIHQAGRYSEAEAKEAERIMPEKCKAVHLPFAHPPAKPESGEAEGWQCVPAKPTLSMCEAGCCVPLRNFQSEGDWISEIYLAMLDAAPQPAKPESGEAVATVQMDNSIALMHRPYEMEPGTELYAHPAKPESQETCSWWKDMDDWDSNLWESKCGASWVLIDEGPIENQMKYCPQCGKKLVVLTNNQESGDE